MLPSRSRLQGWNPDSPSPASTALSGAGQSAYAAVRGLDDDCDRMPEARATGTLAAGLVTGLGNPELAPALAMGGDIFAGWTFGYVGGIIGNIVCR